MRLLRITVVMVRLWTRVYTWRMDPEVRDRRRAEVESDLFEQLAAERGDRFLPTSIIGRWLAGVHNDLMWRVEAEHESRDVMRRIALSGVTVCIVAGLWGLFGLLSAPPPDPPEAPRFRSHLEFRPMPPPPPPPPPLCTPPGIGAHAVQPCTKWP